MNMNFYLRERNRALKLIREDFFGCPGDGDYKTNGEVKQYPHVLKNREFNLHPSVRDDAVKYFKENQIHWHEGKVSPTGHVLSSQIACVNHLFPLRNDKNAVLNLLKTVSDDFIDVFPIPERISGYIQFEAVGGGVKFLGENQNTRGEFCVSLDALIIALHRDGRRFHVFMEWKYVEDYSIEWSGKKKVENKILYEPLIKQSACLFYEKTWLCCGANPFYQLMRQTLWAEKLFEHKVEGFEADDFLHLFVVPKSNGELLNGGHPDLGGDLEKTWRSCLKHPSKFVIVSPAELWSRQDKDTDIYAYLKKRYWDGDI
ncbi:MAG: hypothetical protein LBR53_11805 [Deltaproteobacteria bacterium]|jgi:hypothetical protein|nr:hypothetical protein [Deltaproteobacteria bacterium]